MAIFTSTIGSNARNYATVALWNAALPATAAGDTYNGEAYNDSEFVITAELNLGSAASGYAINLRPATGQGFRDHANKLTNPLRYDQTKGVGFLNQSAGIKTFLSSNANLTIDGLQIKHNQAGGGNYGQPAVTLSSGATAKNCLLQSVNDVGGGVLRLDSGGKASNCLVISQGGTGGNGVFSQGTVNELRNCTIVRASDASTSGTAIGAAYATNATIVKNCAVFGPWTTHFADSGQFDQTNSGYNATSVASGAPGTTGNVYNLTYASQFEGTAVAGLDFRVKAGHGLAVGTRDQTYTADLDIINQARSLTVPTIGAWEAVTSVAFTGTGVITNLRLRSLPASAIFGVVYRITGQLVDPSTGVPRANLTGINAAFFDQATPSALTAPVQTIVNLATDASGNFTWSLPGSTLTLGQTGMLVAYHAGLGYLGSYLVPLVA